MGKEPERGNRVDRVRRRLLRTAAAAGCASALGQLPYERPAVKSFFGVRSAWAAASGPLRITFGQQLGTAPIGSLDPNAGQDRWEFSTCEPNTTLTVSAQTDMNLDAEIYLYPPAAVGKGKVNLLTGDPFGLSVTGVGGTETETVTVGPVGVYTFAIEDKRNPSQERSGSYTVTIDGNRPLTDANLVIDEGPESDSSSGS